MAGTVQNPGTPYVGLIQGGVHDGMQIHVSGVAEHNSKEFLINLQNGPSMDPRCDTPFHFSVRFDENAVVRNSLQRGSWGPEERNGGFPFHKPHDFQVIIQIKDSHYRVSVNGKHFCDYNHRMGKHMATYITVEKGIIIKHISFEQGYPAARGYPGPTGYPGQPAGPIYNPGTPYVGLIQGGVHDGMQIHVSGVAEQNSNAFSINLQNGPSMDPRCDIPFHFSVRFDENAVVRNSLQRGSWGPEERHGGFPFHKPQDFQVTIQIKDSHYRVSVNGKHFCDYNHRMGNPMATYITVERGIIIKDISFEQGV